MNAGELTAAFTTRLRGPAHTHEFVRLILSHCQRLINARLRRVLITNALTVHAIRLLYPVDSELPDALRIESVRYNGRDLDRVLWPTLGHMSFNWFREVGAQPETFSQLGHNLLVIHPALLENNSVDVIATKLTTALAADTDPVDLPDEDLPNVMDLAEAVLMLRERRLTAVAPLIARLAARMRFPDVAQQRPKPSE